MYKTLLSKFNLTAGSSNSNKFLLNQASMMHSPKYKI